MKEITIRDVRDEDPKQIMEIFNHYVKNSYSAFPEVPLPVEMFGMFKQMTAGYPFLVASDGKDKVLGFGFLHPHNRIPTFKRTAEVTYFIHQEHRNQGIGSAILGILIGKGKEMGISNLLASIASSNEESLRFHAKHGFKEVGRFEEVFRKKEKDVDVVWMQKVITVQK
ncbi:MAG: N-acetyltransferase family protein [Thermoplasmatota archaeon]